MKHLSHYRRILIILLACTGLLHLIAFSKSFCDWYTDHLYPYWAEFLGRLTAKVPFVIGEILIVLAALLLLAGVIFLILLPFLRRKHGYRKFTAGYFKTLLMILCGSLLYYSLVWAVPFRGTVLGQNTDGQRTEFSYQEIHALMCYVAEGADAAAEEIEIKEDGSVAFPSEETYRPQIDDALRRLSEEYPRLNGYYPPVKDALSSDLLQRMNIGGVTFPYTMEVLHEKYTAQNPLEAIVTDAHELSHHMGFYKENAATFLSSLAISRSDDPFLRLSGFMQMAYYLQEDYDDTRNEYCKAVCAEKGIPYPSLEDIDIHTVSKDEIKAKLKELERLNAEICGDYPMPGERAWMIQYAADDAETDAYEADAHPIDDMPKVNEAIGKAGDIGWTAQSAVLQEDTYDGIVLLLLQYFDGKLY